MRKIKSYLKLMRIKHYIKNLLIFLPLIFSLSFYNTSYVITTLVGFILFSLTCSVVYIINDINDVEKDRNHPEKCTRPIASGDVKIKEAYVLAIFIVAIVIAIGIIAKIAYQALAVLLVYILLNIAYSKKLKNIPLIDIIILVLGFILRVIYGAIIINVAVSNWLYLTIISFSFYLSLGKRRNEMQKSEENKASTREVLKYYTKNFLDKNMYMCLALTIVFYAMWCVDTINIEKFGNNLIFTVPLLMIICMKYSSIIEGDSYGDPVEVLLADKILIGLVVLYCICMGLIIFIK